MEQWQDQGIVLSARLHGEEGAIVSLLTQEHGRHVGYVRGAQSKAMRGVLERGNSVQVEWQSRVSENMGSYSLDLTHNTAVHFLHDPLRLHGLQAICALGDAGLPEREVHSGLYHGTRAVFDIMKQDDMWLPAYVIWELQFLKELGFSLELTRCGAGSDDPDLLYVSPKTGRAISRSAGAPYKEKLLPLPAFLSAQKGGWDHGEAENALQMTGYFLEHWAFAQHSRGIPEARLRFAERFASLDPN